MTTVRLMSKQAVLVLALGMVAYGQQSSPANDKSSETSESTQTTTTSQTEGPPLQPIPNYKGDLSTREAMTGDWGGLRTELAEMGITFNIDLTQIFQGNARGGKDTNNGVAYSGSTDYEIKFDFQRMGLWPGAFLRVKGETQFGHSINSKVGSIMSPNSDALFPVPDDSGITTLTDVEFTQFFSEHFGIQIGRIDFRGGDSNVFAHDERTQFMNLGLVANPILLSLAPYTALMATAIFIPTDWLTTSFTVLDSNGQET